VIVVEAGPDHGTAPAGAPGGPVLDRPARLAPDVLVARRPESLPQTYAQGFGLGGSSLVNGGVIVGDPAVEADGHALPIEAVSGVGPVAAAVSRATPDAHPVALVRRDGRRVSAAEAYLRPARHRKNLSVISDTHVDRVAVDGRTTIGVVTRAGDHLGADRVIMCAGAIATPALLLRSGIETPGVGRRLQDHVGIAISFDLHAPSDDAVAIGVTVERPGRQLVVMDRLPDHPEMGAILAGRLAIESEGQVTLPDPDGPPVAELNQLGAASDLDGLVEVVTEALTILRESPVSDVIGERYVDRAGTSPDLLERDDDALRAWLPQHLGGYHHVSGSCRVGGPLDHHGRLLDYEGLFVADASALPGVPHRNPYLTVIRQAEVMARSWLVG